MNQILLIILLIFVIGCGALVQGEVSSGSAATATEDKDLTEMRSFLAGHTIIQFVAQAKISGWQIPSIRSNWYVQRLPKRPSQQLEQARRDFGFELLKKLNSPASVAKSSGTDSTTLEEEASSLLLLRDLLIKSAGYENLFLARRCVDVAAVAVARLVANLNYPISKAEALVALFTDDWESPNSRVQALNAEAEGAPFPVTPLKQEEVLREMWSENVTTALSRKSAGTLHQSPQLEIFADDEVSDLPEVTTETLWNRKMHFLLVQGLKVKSVANLRALLIFRQKVGSFPTTGGVKVFQEDSSITSAFRHAWVPFQFEHKDQNWRLLYVGAAELYERVASGKLADEDSLQSESASSRNGEK